MTGLAAGLLAVVLCFGGVLGARWASGRALGVRAIGPDADFGRPAAAFVRAAASLVGYYLACVTLFAIALATGGTTSVDETSMRVSVAAGGPAAEAGLVDGDRVVAVDGAPMHDWDELKKAVASHGTHPSAAGGGAPRSGDERPMRVDVERGGAPMHFDVSPRGGKMRVGPHVDKRDPPIHELVGEAFADPPKIVAASVRTFFRMLAGAEKAELAGAVGITREVDAAGHDAFATALKLCAAMASYYWLWVGAALAGLALVSAFRKTPLPTARHSS